MTKSANEYKCKSPVLYLSFNRLDIVEQTLPKILQARPPKIYLASDGARENRRDANGELESSKVAQVREYMLNLIHKTCKDSIQVETRFLDSNFGCKMAVSSHLAWFFSHEREGIILEDDCMPAASFFQYCDTLLEKYRENTQIFLIGGWSGINVKPQLKKHIKSDYFFSKYGHIWGWASWANRFEKYERDAQSFESCFDKMKFNNKAEKKYWREILEICKKNYVDTWDYQLGFTKFKHNSINIQPINPLIKNIGCNRDDATHAFGTSFHDDWVASEVSFPLKEPREIKDSKKLDIAIFESVFLQKESLLKHYINKLSKKILKRAVV